MTEQECFNLALDFVLRWEGGYVHHKDDPGGETSLGISKRAYPNEDIANMTKKRASEIYYNDYWVKSGADRDATYGDYGLAIFVFDSSVNCGVKRTRDWLIKANTLVFDRIKNHTYTSWEVVEELFKIRQEHYERQNKPMFIKGWMNRLSALKTLLETL